MTSKMKGYRESLARFNDPKSLGELAVAPTSEARRIAVQDPIEALRAVYEAATPGPWEVRDGMNVKGASSLHVATTMGSETPRRDARAIAVTHNVMPELLAVAWAVTDSDTIAALMLSDHPHASDCARALVAALDDLRAKAAEVMR